MNSRKPSIHFKIFYVLFICYALVAPDRMFAQDFKFFNGRKAQTIGFDLKKSLIIIPIYINDKGPFDFIFSDADKGWYTNYFIDVYPKLKIGGCYTAHNVTDRKGGRSWARGADEFYEYIKNLPNMQTTLDSSGNGISISYKKSAE